MISPLVLGAVGGLTYTLIILNPGFKFSKLGITGQDFLYAALINGFLGSVAAFLGWCFAGGQIQPPRSYGLYILCGVGGGSLIQSWALTLTSIQSKAMLDRALEAVESLARTQSGPAGSRLESLSRSLRSETDRHQRQEISREMVLLANKIAAQSGR